MLSGHSFERLGVGVDPGQKIVDGGVGMAVDDYGMQIGEPGVGSTPRSLQVSISDATTAEFSPPPAEPAKSAFFLRANDRRRPLAPAQWGAPFVSGLLPPCSATVGGAIVTNR
jgi:hypothetical protein